MIDACVLTTLIEILFPQETVFNCGIYILNYTNYTDIK